MTMTGHKTRSVCERYNIVSEADMAEAASRLDDFTGTNAQTRHSRQETRKTQASQNQCLGRESNPHVR